MQTCAACGRAESSQKVYECENVQGFYTHWTYAWSTTHGSLVVGNFVDTPAASVTRNKSEFARYRATRLKNLSRPNQGACVSSGISTNTMHFTCNFCFSRRNCSTSWTISNGGKTQVDLVESKCSNQELDGEQKIDVCAFSPLSSHIASTSNGPNLWFKSLNNFFRSAR